MRDLHNYEKQADAFNICRGKMGATGLEPVTPAV
jgi:hypothetical protein